MILAGEPNTACLTYARQTWGVSRSQGCRLLKRAWRQIHDDIEGPDLDRQESWPGAFRPCWRPPARPRPNGTQERWWLPSASSTGCAGRGSTHQPGTGSTDVRSEPLGSLSAELRILVRDTSRKKTDEAGLKNPPFSCVVIGLTSHSTGGVTVPIRVPTPTTTSTRSSIHFIEKPQKKTPLSGGADFRVLMVRTAGRSESLSQ